MHLRGNNQIFVTYVTGDRFPFIYDLLDLFLSTRLNDIRRKKVVIFETIELEVVAREG